MSATVPGTEQITIRKCDGMDELNACVTLQKEVWNFDDVDLIPLRMFVVSQKIGGQVIGAFDGSTLVGFAFSIPGSRSGHAYLHSHMLAVRESYRNYGLGRRLKLAQRDDAIEHGDQERASQPGAPGRDRAALQRQPLRALFVSAARRVAHGPPGGGVVAEIKTRDQSSG